MSKLHIGRSGGTLCGTNWRFRLAGAGEIITCKRCLSIVDSLDKKPKLQCCVCRKRNAIPDDILCSTCAYSYMRAGEPRTTNELIKWVAGKVWRFAK